MWDTIEHLRQPEQYIEKISKQMASGALLAITTGDIGSLNARLRKEQWRLIHPPTHIHYFSKQSIATMLNNYGFDVVYNQYCGFYRSVDNIAYNIFVLRHKQPKLYKLLKSLRLTELDFYLNLYDIMYVIAKKDNLNIFVYSLAKLIYLQEFYLRKNTPYLKNEINKKHDKDKSKREFSQICNCRSNRYCYLFANSYCINRSIKIRTCY